MKDFEGKTFSNGDVEYTIHKHLGVLEIYTEREVPWTKEVNIVSWNGGQAKVDIRDWSEDHEKMSRGITLTEEQGMKLTGVLLERYNERARQIKAKAEKDRFER